MNDETFHKFRSIIVFRAFHSIISHRVVSIKQRFERISKTARATLIYIGFCRSFENMIRNLLEYFVIYRRMRTFEFREIDEPLCVSRSRIIDRVEARKEKIASQKFRSRGEGKSDNVARFRYNGASTNLPQNNTSLQDRVQA